MSDPLPSFGPGYQPPAGRDPGNLADILERVLDRGVVIAGDIRVNLLDIELLTIKLRLVVASVDTAREMGIDWWEHDPFLGARARRPVESDPGRQAQVGSNRQAQLGSGPDGGPSDGRPDRPERRAGDDRRRRSAEVPDDE